MAISTNQIHDNLVELTSRMNGGTPEENEIHDNLTGIAQLAGNEEEAAAADVIQTLSFSTWIKDICDGVKQEKELDYGTPEYNENENAIRDDIQNINNLGHQFGMNKDIIPTPKAGQETKVAAQAVYSNFALPYEANANVDYSKYMQVQEGNNQISRAMRNLSRNVAQSNQYSTHAKRFWEAQQKAATNYNALAGEFLDGLDSLNMYEKEIMDAKTFLRTEQENSENGITNANLNGKSESKIDFEHDDPQLQSNLQDAINKASKLIKIERKMLQAGHVDAKRRGLAESMLKSYVAEIKNAKEQIKVDDVQDMNATKELQQERQMQPEKVSPEQEKQYEEMVQKQAKEKPTFDMDMLSSCANDFQKGLDEMNKPLRDLGIGMIDVAKDMINMRQTPATKCLTLIKIGKLIYDYNKSIKEEHADNQSFDMEPEYKGAKKQENENEIEIVDEPPMSKRISMAIKHASEEFRDRMRRIVGEDMIQLDENAPDYNATQDFNESVEHMIDNVVTANDDASVNNKSAALIGLANTIKMGTGKDIFDKDPQDMTSDELNVYSMGVTSVMGPMKDKNGKYLQNFIDCYAVGEETLPAAQQEYTDAMTNLMIVGQPKEALAVRESQTDLINLSQQYQDLSSNDNLMHVEDDTEKYHDIERQADKADDRMRHIVDVYKPLCVKAGILGASAMYQKHEFNKAWKEAVRERNLQLMCQGTMNAMEKSQRENEMLAHEALYGQHGLLRG